MYLAIEGIKGSGKSTLLESLRSKGDEIKGLQLFPITAPMERDNPYEKILKSECAITKQDSFVETLFVKRAYWHHKDIDHRGFVLGDRSIATACVTRWNTWSDPYYTISRVKEQYKGILPLNVMIWIKTDVSTSIQRIKNRTRKETGIRDEKESALYTAVATYEELFREKIYQRKIGKVQFVEINNHEDIDQTSTELLNIIKFYSIR